MACKKVGEVATKNGIAELAKRVPISQALQFKDFQAKHAEYIARVNRHPEKLPNIDFEYYRNNVRADFVKMVSEFEQKYKCVCEAFDKRHQQDKSKYFVEIDELKQQVQDEVEKYKAASNERIKALEAKYAQIQALIPYEEMTAEEYVELLPDKSFYKHKGEPSFWPHTPDEQGPGPSVAHGHDDDGGHDGGAGNQGGSGSGSSKNTSASSENSGKPQPESNVISQAEQPTKPPPVDPAKRSVVKQQNADFYVSCFESKQFKQDLEQLKECFKEESSTKSVKHNSEEKKDVENMILEILNPSSKANEINQKHINVYDPNKNRTTQTGYVLKAGDKTSTEQKLASSVNSSKNTVTETAGKTGAPDLGKFLEDIASKTFNRDDKRDAAKAQNEKLLLTNKATGKNETEKVSAKNMPVKPTDVIKPGLDLISVIPKNADSITLKGLQLKSIGTTESIAEAEVLYSKHEQIKDKNVQKITETNNLKIETVPTKDEPAVVTYVKAEPGKKDESKELEPTKVGVTELNLGAIQSSKEIQADVVNLAQKNQKIEKPHTKAEPIPSSGKATEASLAQDASKDVQKKDVSTETLNSKDEPFQTIPSATPLVLVNPADCEVSNNMQSNIVEERKRPEVTNIEVELVENNQSRTIALSENKKAPSKQKTAEPIIVNDFLKETQTDVVAFSEQSYPARKKQSTQIAEESKMQVKVISSSEYTKSVEAIKPKFEPTKSQMKITDATIITAPDSANSKKTETEDMTSSGKNLVSKVKVNANISAIKSKPNEAINSKGELVEPKPKVTEFSVNTKTADIALKKTQANVASSTKNTKAAVAIKIEEKIASSIKKIKPTEVINLKIQQIKSNIKPGMKAQFKSSKIVQQAKVSSPKVQQTSNILDTHVTEIINPKVLNSSEIDLPAETTKKGQSILKVVDSTLGFLAESPGQKGLETKKIIPNEMVKQGGVTAAKAKPIQTILKATEISSMSETASANKEKETNTKAQPVQSISKAINSVLKSTKNSKEEKLILSSDVIETASVNDLKNEPKPTPSLTIESASDKFEWAKVYSQHVESTKTILKSAESAFVDAVENEGIQVRAITSSEFLELTGTTNQKPKPTQTITPSRQDITATKKIHAAKESKPKLEPAQVNVKTAESISVNMLEKVSTNTKSDSIQSLFNVTDDVASKDLRVKVLSDSTQIEPVVTSNENVPGITKTSALALDGAQQPTGFTMHKNGPTQVNLKGFTLIGLPETIAVKNLEAEVIRPSELFESVHSVQGHSNLVKSENEISSKTSKKNEATAEESIKPAKAAKAES